MIDLDLRKEELRVSVDVGYRHHHVAMGFSGGGVLEEFEIEHRIEGLKICFLELRNTVQCATVRWRWRWKVLMAGRGHSTAWCASAVIGFTTSTI
jgi:hypothetical protein